MISVAEARERILATAPAPRPEVVMVSQALGRVLAAPVLARRTQPPADMSAMDGYAVRAEDVAEAGAKLRVIGEAPAGRPFAGRVGPGEAVRIFTGGETPEGADAVVLQEDAERTDDTVVFSEAATLGRHIRRAGLDFVADETMIPSGSRMTPRNLALAAGMNVVWATVARRPRIAILATGDEIRMPGDTLGPGQIIGSSGLAVAGMATELGADPVMLEVARDNEAALLAAADAARGADILVTLGGASVGDHDLVQDVLGKAGLEVDFWRIAMRPGKPLMFGKLGPQLVLGLPGNPVSTMVCATLFLAPLIKRMQGVAEVDPPMTTAIAMTPLKANDRREDYLRAKLSRSADGELQATPFFVQDSSMMSVFAASDCLIVRPPHAPATDAGVPVPVLLLDSL